jgi:hypothetical protein
MDRSGSTGIIAGRNGMITTLNVKCPHCEQVSQIFLTSTVSVIILNCPSCLSPIMYFRRKIFLLDPQQLKKMRGNSRTSLVTRLLEQIAGAEAAAQCPVNKAAQHLHHRGAYVPLSHKLTLEHYGAKRITEDDCTNLRIELELCADSQQFIDRL